MSGVGSRGPPSRTPSKVIDGIRLRESSFDPGDVVVHTIDGGVVSLVGELGTARQKALPAHQVLRPRAP